MSDQNSGLPLTGTTEARKQAASFLPVLLSASQGATVPPAHRPGWQTTEFWVTLLLIIGTIAESLTGLSPKWAAIVAAVAASSYNLSRGLAKLLAPLR